MSNEIKPILKWVGGKRQLLPEIIPLINKNCEVYVEPFIGGGAVFFELQPEKAIINDYNSELINLYTIIKNEPEKLIEKLQDLKTKNNKDDFYRIREMDRNEDYSKIDNVDKAARLIYLNKTCFNGLYRVNSKGYYNTPFGAYKNPNICNEELILNISKYFNNNNIEIVCGDYKKILENLPRNAFVYLDPPYMPLSASSSFTSYTDTGFNYEQQVELKNECDKLQEQGISFIQSNSDCSEIRELYKDYEIKTVYAKRNINSKGDLRGEIAEVLIMNTKNTND
jgi:DNA adenine methylase